MADMRIDDFFDEFANAMRVGSPGACDPDAIVVTEIGGEQHRVDSLNALPYHVLPRDHVDKVREQSAAGGIVYCERCDTAIFVPGLPGRGIEVRGFPGEINLKGVSF